MTPPKMPQRFADLFESAGMQLWAGLGAVTDRSVRVWMRSEEPGHFPVTLVSGGSVAAATVIETDPLHDGVGYADVELPAPLPNRPFSVEVAGMRRNGVFAPAPGEPRAFSFLLGSCNQPFRRGESKAEPSAAAAIYHPLVDKLVQRQASFSLLVGDQVYADGVEGLNAYAWAQAHPDASDDDLLSVYRQVYRSYLGQRDFSRLLSHVPSYLIWDDHEILNSWGSHTQVSDLERRLFRQAGRAYVEYEHTHNPGSSFASAGPFHYHFWHGTTGFFVLDVRSERDYNRGALVDEEQWRSLEDFLAEAATREVTTVFIAASIPVVHFSPLLVRLAARVRHREASLARERWGSNAFLPHRQRLLDLLFRWQTEAPYRKVCILSGDVHAAAALRVRQKGGRGVISQWTSSGLCTPTGLSHAIANRIGTTFVNLGEEQCRSEVRGLEAENNFGLIEVTPSDGAGHDLRFSVFKYGAGAKDLTLAFSDRA